jgi:DNA-directed RNA polymerase specialized sigma subunit
MTPNEIDRKVESFFRSYRKLQWQLQILQPRYTQIMREAAGSGQSSATSWVEELAAKRADIANQIRLIELSLNLLTRDERAFVEYRYFQEIPMREMTEHMVGWSEREIYRLRRSVLAKTAWVITGNQ